MALGEAFVNVRADLKPFSKDLQKGISAILKQAEKKIAADPSLGRAIGTAMQRNIGRGVGQGLEEGFDDGAKKGAKKALTTGQKFLAALADFADDGISAIPGKVKAAIILGLAAAAAVVAPFLGGVISAAITSGVSIGIAGAGIAIASQFEEVQDQFVGVGRTLLDLLRSDALVFIDPLVAAGEQILDSFDRINESIRRTFADSAKQIQPLTTALTGFVEQLMPGIESSVRAARPLIDALSIALPRLGRDFATFLRIISDGSPEAVTALTDLLRVFGQLLINLGLTVRGLTEVYFWMRVVAATARGDVAGALQLLADRELAARSASGELQGGLGDVNGALGETAAEALAAREAIGALITEQLRGVDATIDFEQAYDDLRESIKEGNRDFRVTEENGRKNLRLVQQGIDAAARQRDDAIANAAVTGQSVDQINAHYQRQIDKLAGLTTANKQQDQVLKDIIATARSAPSDVSIQVKTPGADAAITKWNAIRAAIRSTISAAVEYINKQRSAERGGLQTAVQRYADGAILTQPTVGLMAEAGYAEAVIPDPAVKPQRALQLANEFGLTQLIADTIGAGRQVINVFVGGRQLEAMIDYRIGYGNAMNATAMAQGPRGV